MFNLTHAHPYYLTDGGLETTLIFHQGIDLPHFAAFELLTHPAGQKALRQYYLPYLRIAQQYGLHFILETPTWRANTDWGFKLGYSPTKLQTINRQAVHFMRELADGLPSLISGCIGPRSDGYTPRSLMRIQEAQAYHQPQISIFAEEAANMVTAMTLNYSDEAIGIVQAAQAVSIPVAISFTVETDGKLPNGESLQEAIERTDRCTNGYASHFMINCAHPEHFVAMLQQPGDWKQRIRGIRANASVKSHAELDECETLDAGDKHALAKGYAQLMELLPALRIIGGCCGTDHSHMEEICKLLFAAAKQSL